MCDSTFDRTLYPAYQRKKMPSKEQAPSAVRPKAEDASTSKGFLGKEKGPHDSVEGLLKKIVPED